MARGQDKISEPDMGNKIEKEDTVEELEAELQAVREYVEDLERFAAGLAGRENKTEVKKLISEALASARAKAGTYSTRVNLLRQME